MVMRQSQFKDNIFFENKISRNQKSHGKMIEALPNALNDRHKATILRGANDYSKRVCISSYTIGGNIEKIKYFSNQWINDVLSYIEITNKDLMNSGILESYIDCLWMISFCYFFNIPKEKVQIIADHISLTGKDMLIDRLIAASIPDHPIAVGKLAFPEVYKPLSEALASDQTTEERTEKIQLFLKNYYPLLKKYQVTWHDSHKEQDPEYCYHFGYWIFELGALAADIGWDDTAYRDHEMYPKDLVDWKFAQRPDYRRSKI